MNHTNTSVSFAANELAQGLLAIPPGRRGPMMQSVASFRSHESLDDTFAVDHFCAAFAHLWEEQFKTSVPIAALRSLMEPTIPIGTVLQFSSLMHARQVQDLQPELRALEGFLHAQIRQHNEQPSSSCLTAIRNEPHTPSLLIPEVSDLGHMSPR